MALPLASSVAVSHLFTCTSAADATCSTSRECSSGLTTVFATPHQQNLNRLLRGQTATFKGLTGRQSRRRWPRGAARSEGSGASESEGPELPPPGGYRGLAVASVAVAVGLFSATRVLGIGIDLSTLSAISVPFDEAVGNGRPTVVEFYADWCEVCRQTARDVYQVEQDYRDRVNFVMLNIDNPQWSDELAEFGVEGIPHFTFLDGQGNEEAFVVGKLPKRIFQENVSALSEGKVPLPHSNFYGETSSASEAQAPPLVGPRSHGKD